MDWNKVEIWEGPTTSTPLQAHLLVYLTGHHLALKEARNEGIMPAATRWKHD